MRRRWLLGLLCFALLVGCRNMPFDQALELSWQTEPQPDIETSLPKEIGINEVQNDYSEERIYHINYPQTNFVALDQEIEQWHEKLLGKFLEDVKEHPSKDGFRSELNVDYQIRRSGGKVNLIFYSLIYLAGDAHPLKQIHCMIYDEKADKLMKFEDLLPGKKAGSFRDTLYEIFQKEGKEPLMAREEFDLELLNNISLGNGHLVIFFNPYTLFPGSEGIVEVRIPYSSGKKESPTVEIRTPSEEETPLAPEVPPVMGPPTPVEPPENETKAEPSPDKPALALTFDDGPSSHTGELLDILKENGVHATFFLLGVQIQGREEIIRRQVAEGHSVGNHSWNHRQFTLLSDTEIRQQIEETDRLVREAASIETKWVRPPYGAMDERVRNDIAKTFILWNVDTMDWKNKDAAWVEQQILEGARDGAIILMHDVHPSTIEGVKRALPKLIEKGYQILNIEELLKKKGINPQPGEKYFNLP